MLEIFPISSHLLKQAGLIRATHAFRILSIRCHRVTVDLPSRFRLLESTSSIIPIFFLRFRVVSHFGIECRHPNIHAHICHSVISSKIVQNFKFCILLFFGKFSQIQPKYFYDYIYWS